MKMTGLGISILVVVAMLFMFTGAAAQTGKFNVAMTGRSVMDMWFRHMNLPSFLNRLSIYKNWPLSYKKYEKESLVMEYVAVPPPHRNYKPGVNEFGNEMFSEVKKILATDRHDALLFKFCFVDFGDKSIDTEKAANERFEELVKLTMKVHDLTRSKKRVLILGNSLPSLTPGQYAQGIRLRYNAWVGEYAAKNANDVVMIDLYTPLVDIEGRLKREYSVNLSESDSHPNALGFKALEKELFTKIDLARKTARK